MNNKDKCKRLSNGTQTDRCNLLRVDSLQVLHYRYAADGGLIKMDFVNRTVRFGRLSSSTVRSEQALESDIHVDSIVISKHSIACFGHLLPRLSSLNTTSLALIICYHIITYLPIMRQGHLSVKSVSHKRLALDDTFATRCGVPHVANTHVPPHLLQRVLAAH